MSAKIRTAMDKLQQNIREKGGYLRELRVATILYDKESTRLSLVLIDDRLSRVDYYIEYRFDLQSIVLMEGIFSTISQTTAEYLCICFDGICHLD